MDVTVNFLLNFILKEFISYSKHFKGSENLNYRKILAYLLFIIFISHFTRIGRNIYWNQDDELNLPTFIDIIGFDPQLSDPSQEDTVNSMVMNLIINGCLPENCDLLDLSKKLKDGQEPVEIEENKSLAVDAIIVVISAQCSNLSQNVFSEIYKEANTKTKSKGHVSFAFNFKEF